MFVCNRENEHEEREKGGISMDINIPDIKCYHGDLDHMKLCGKLARTNDGFVSGILHFKLKHDLDGKQDFDICPLIDEQAYSILFSHFTISSKGEPLLRRDGPFGATRGIRLDYTQHIFSFGKNLDIFTGARKFFLGNESNIDSFYLHCGKKEYVVSLFPPSMVKDGNNVLICARKYGSCEPFQPLWEDVKPSAHMSPHVSGLKGVSKKDEEEETGEKMDSSSVSSAPSIRLPVMSMYGNTFGSLLTTIPYVVSSKHRDFLLTSSGKCLEVNFNIVRKCYELVPISPKKLPPWIQGLESFKDDLLSEYEACVKKRLELGTAIGFPGIVAPKPFAQPRSGFGGGSAFNQSRSTFGSSSSSSFSTKADKSDISISKCCIVRGWDLAQGPIICVSWKVDTNAVLTKHGVQHNQYANMMKILIGVKDGTIDPASHKISGPGFGSFGSFGSSDSKVYVADLMKNPQWKELFELECRVKDVSIPQDSTGSTSGRSLGNAFSAFKALPSIKQFHGTSLISISGEPLAHVPSCHVDIGYGYRDRLYMFSHSIESPKCRVLLPEDDMKDVIAKDSLHKTPIEVEKLRIGDIVPSDGWDMSIQFVPLVLREIVWKAGCQRPSDGLFSSAKDDKRINTTFDLSNWMLLQDHFLPIGSVGKEGYLVHGALPHSYAIDRGCSKEGGVSDDGEVDLVHGHAGCKHVSLVEMKQICAINRALRSTSRSGGFHPLLPKDTFFSIGLNQTTNILRATLIDRSSLLKTSSTPLVYNQEDFNVAIYTLPPVLFPLLSTETWQNGYEKVTLKTTLLSESSVQPTHITYVRKYHRKHYKLVYGTSQCPDSLRSTSFSPISLSDLNKMGGIPLWVCVGGMILECVCYGIRYDQSVAIHECVSREEMLSYVSEDECKQQMLRDVESLKSGVMSVKEVEHAKEEESALVEKEEEEETEKEVRVSKDVSSSSDMGTDVS
ncbi:hypothetical protein ADUPG1_007333, partial [Aduncisulcus paluster]